MVEINKVELQGFIGRVKETQVNDVYVYDLSVATNLSYGNVIELTWHSVKVWSNEKLSWLEKGKGIHVDGRIRTNSYVDKDGNDRRINYVYAKAENVKLAK